MDVGLDEARDHQPAVEHVRPAASAAMLGGDLGDAAVRNADVEQRGASLGEPRLAQDEIERHAAGLLRRLGAAEIGRLELGVVGRARRRVSARTIRPDSST